MRQPAGNSIYYTRAKRNL